MRKQLLGAFEAQMARGIDVCSTQCMSANDERDLDCMIEAKTGARRSRVSRSSAATHGRAPADLALLILI